MRVSESVEIDAPVAEVWELVSDADRYGEFMSGVTRWEVVSDTRHGPGTRVQMLLRVGAAEVGGLIEIVEWAEQRDIAWHSVTGVDLRGRWRLRPLDADRCRLELRFAYGVAGAGLGGWLAELLAAPQLRSHIKTTLARLKRQAESSDVVAAGRAG